MSEERQSLAKERRLLLLAAAAFCAAAIWFGGQIFWPAANDLTHGFGAYYSASRLLVRGELSAEIYDPDYFRAVVQEDSEGEINDIFNANPPTTTLMFLPLSFLPIRQARMLWTFANLVFLLAGLGLLLSAFGVPIRERLYWPVLLIVLGIGLLFRPTVQTIMQGQAYLLIFFLLSITTTAFFKTHSAITWQEANGKGQGASEQVASGQVASEQVASGQGASEQVASGQVASGQVASEQSEITNHQSPITPFTGGIALAFSLLFKTAGWPLLILLFWLRKGRLLAWTLGFTAVILLITLPIFPMEMWLAFGRLLSEVGRSPFICVPAYQTTRSWLCHLFAPGVLWQEAELTGAAIPGGVTVTYFILGIACLLALWRLARRRPQAAFMGFVCLGVLLLPLGEVHHHTVMLIPLVWLIAGWQGYNRIGRIIIILAAAAYILPFPVNAPMLQSGWLSLLAYPYLAAAWLTFGGIFWPRLK